MYVFWELVLHVIMVVTKKKTPKTPTSVIFLLYSVSTVRIRDQEVLWLVFLL